MTTTKAGKSRRALLAGAAMGAAALAAARPDSADAADGEPLLLGASNTADTATQLECTSTEYDGIDLTCATTGAGISVTNTAAGIGVYAEGENGCAIIAFSKSSTAPCVQASCDGGNAGVYAESVGPHTGEGGEGVYAQSGITNGTTPGLTRTGVHGVCDNQAGNGMWGESVAAGYGVLGTTSSTSTAGVRGVNAGTGYGVRADSNGTGLYAEGPEAAIEAIGTVKFSTSGVAIIPGTTAKPASKITVKGVTLTPQSFVLATVQEAFGGGQVMQAVPNATAGTVTIYLAAPVTVHVKVGWFVIN
jgi:hypothetical protein